jgi:methyl-accepting chemotaxis protein
MDQVTQQNAALVEEAAAAAESMEEQAQGLSRTVGVFRVSESKRPPLPVQRISGTNAEAGRPVQRPALVARAGTQADADEWEEF